LAETLGTDALPVADDESGLQRAAMIVLCSVENLRQPKAAKRSLGNLNERDR
jgi:hypothetical protein